MVGFYYSSVMSTAPSATVSPLATAIAATFPSRSVLMLFSIFMASSMATVCPLVTVSPTFTFTSMMRCLDGISAGGCCLCSGCSRRCCCRFGCGCGGLGHYYGLGSDGLFPFYCVAFAVDLNLCCCIGYLVYCDVVLSAIYFVLIFFHGSALWVN